MLGPCAPLFWSFPPVLMHLAGLARAEGNRPLAALILWRIIFQAERGVRGMPSETFNYAARAELLEMEAEAGRARSALRAWESTKPNPGNVILYHLLGAWLHALSGQLEEATRRTAEQLRPRGKPRTGWGLGFCERWIHRMEKIPTLRQYPPWRKMLRNPDSYLAARSKPKPQGSQTVRSG